MVSPAVLLACAALSLPSTLAAETILGVYIFSRHGDRTAKSTPPTNLTDLGYREIYESGSRFRSRYIASNATSKIAGINSDLVKLSQLTASAPLDNVLMSSAQGFLQGLYPPVGNTLGSNKLRNGTVVEAPLDGYQLIPIQTAASGSGSEDSAWLQGSTNCANALADSNAYFYSTEYLGLLNSSMGFYKSLAPMINNTFTDNQTSYKNAYTIFDLLNVASIHNATFPSSDLLTPSAQSTLQALAATHEYALAYNASSSIRAIAGSVLAAQILQSLNSTLTTAGKAPKLTLQVGAYASFQSFFGLASLPTASANFTNIPDYAASMTFELFTTGPVNPFPSPADVSVRFTFHNGTSATGPDSIAYPLFGGNATALSWTDFATAMGKFAIGDQTAWCQACGNSTGVCAAAGNETGPAGTDGAGQTGGAAQSGGMSNAVAGVIGAMVTLAVILGVEALVMLVGGMRLVRKRTAAAGVGNGVKA